MKILGERIKLLRDDKRLSQEEMGALFKIDRSAISKYENNLLSIPHELLKAIAMYFDVSLDYLYGFTELRKPLESDSYESPTNYQITTPPNNDSPAETVDYMARLQLIWPRLTLSDKEYISKMAEYLMAKNNPNT